MRGSRWVRDNNFCRVCILPSLGWAVSHATIELTTKELLEPVMRVSQSSTITIGAGPRFITNILDCNINLSTSIAATFDPTTVRIDGVAVFEIDTGTVSFMSGELEVEVAHAKQVITLYFPVGHTFHVPFSLIYSNVLRDAAGNIKCSVGIWSGISVGMKASQSWMNVSIL